MEKGLSVLICSHNGAARIGQTLDHLTRQVFEEPIFWEVVLVDNASTDGLEQKAILSWDSNIPLRVIFEPRLGVTYARITGMNHCRYAYIGFIDDDNWASRDWVERAFHAIDSKPDAGAVGGANTAVFEAEPPAWFERYSRNYAVGEQYETSGIVEKPDGMLWGAGLVLRNEAWQQLVSLGYEPLIQSRKGENLTSGEETEILLSFRLLGWKLYYDKQLKLEHYMPIERMTWKYHLRLRRGLGAASVYLDLYRSLLAWSQMGVDLQNETWLKSINKVLLAIIKDPFAILASPFAQFEGNYRIARYHFFLGALRERIAKGLQIDKIRADLFTKVKSWPLRKGM
ncbi:MAG: glycosyltransferase [Anaerolineaceae bacterium]